MQHHRNVHGSGGAAVLVALIASLLTACDGPGFTGAEPEPTQSPTGIYAGTFTSTATGQPVTNTFSGLISERRNVQLLSQSLHYSGTVSADGSTLTGTLTEYRGRVRRFLGIDGLSSITLSGSVAERSRISGEYSGTGDQGSFDLAYDDEYERLPSLDQTAGIWTFNEAVSGGGVYTVTFDIDNNGQIFGNDTDGCIFSGQLSTIDSDHNAYLVSVDIPTCPGFVGEYRGLAFLSPPAAGQNDRLTFAISNSSFAFSAIFDKM